MVNGAVAATEPIGTIEDWDTLTEDTRATDADDQERWGRKELNIFKLENRVSPPLPPFPATTNSRIR